MAKTNGNGKTAATATWEHIAAHQFDVGNYQASIAAALMAVCGTLRDVAQAFREAGIPVEVWRPTEQAPKSGSGTSGEFPL